MTKKVIVGIAGYKGSGKDTAADYLRTILKGSIFHYATPVKEIVNTVFGVPMDYMEDRELKESKFELSDGTMTTIRKLMQFVGEEFRKIDSSVWLSKCLRDINNHYKLHKDESRMVLMFYFIPDLRHPNEAETCDVKIKIERDSIVRTCFNSSETSLDDYTGFDYIVKNNGTIEDFYKELNSIAAELNARFL